MNPERRFQSLRRAWAPIEEWDRTTDPLCPCRELVGPILKDWRNFESDALAGALDVDGLQEQEEALLHAVNTIKQYARQDDVGEIKRDFAQYQADTRQKIRDDLATCDLSDPRCRPLAGDTRMGAADASTAAADPMAFLSSLADAGAKAIGSAAQGAGADAGKAAGQAAAASATEAAKQATPGIIAEASKAASAQIPALVNQATQVLAGSLQPMAQELGKTAGKAAGEEAGKAAVKSAQEEARKQAWSTGEKAVGVGVGVVVIGGIGYGIYRLLGGGSRKRSAA